MKTHDVAIVGGGPIGGYVAGEIAQAGYDVVVFEEHKQAGAPRKCAGLVTPRTLDFFSFSTSNIIQNEIYGANIHSPSGKTLSIGGDKLHAYAIDRPRLDAAIISRAGTGGADVLFDHNVLTAQRATNGVVVTSKHKNTTKQIICNLVIGADGAHSKIRDIFHFPQPAETLIGMGAEVTNTRLDPKYVELFVGNKVAPGFFAWVIPITEDGTKARIGLCTLTTVNQSVKYYFSHLFKHRLVSPFLQKAKVTNYIAGSIPLGLLKKTVDTNVMLVGDAAAQVKPTSGGGVYTGLSCARYCSAVAVEALSKKIFTNQFLKKYQKAWVDDLGRELLWGMRFRTIFKNLTDRHLDKYFEKINDEKILEAVNEHGDIDYPSKLIMPLLKKTPSLLKLLVHYKNMAF